MFSQWPGCFLRFWVGVFIIVIMPSCVSLEEQRRSMVDHCYRLGFKDNSPEFSNCIARLYRQTGISQQCAGAFRYGSSYSYGRCMSERLR